MKWRWAGLVFAAVCFFVVAYFVGSQRPGPQDIDGTSLMKYDAGAIFVSPEEHSAIVLSHVFQVKNITSERWSLRWIGSSCGCTKPDPLNAVLEPGEEVSIKVRVDAQHRSDRVKEYAEFVTGGSKIKAMRLLVAAEIYPRLSVLNLPDRCLSVPQSGLEWKTTVLVRQEKSEPVAPLEVECIDASGNVIPTNLNSPATVGLDSYQVSRFPVSVHFPPASRAQSVLMGEQNTVKLRITTTSWRLEESFRWAFATPISVHPRNVFVKSSPDATATAKIELKAELPFRVLRADSSLPSLRLVPADEKTAEASDKVHQYILEVPPGGSSDRNSRFEKFVLTFSTTHPDQETVAIPASIYRSDVRQSETGE